MARAIYYTATTLDGYIADEHDSLAWLFEQETDEGGPAGYAEFIAGIGAMVMGATTYVWVGDHMAQHRRGRGPTTSPAGCSPTASTSRWARTSGSWPARSREHHAAIAESAGDRDIWVVGGGDLAGQFADLGLLDQVVVSIAPVTLGAGRPLFPRRHNLKLVELGRNGDFAMATYDVVGARTD